jgi:hypothetical protein
MSILAVFATSLATADDGQISHKLIVAYSFEKATVLDRGSNKYLQDISGNDNLALIVGDGAVAPGKVGDALNFDGDDDWVVTSPVEFGGRVTIMAWVFCRNTDHRYGRIAEFFNQRGDSLSLSFGDRDGHLRGSVYWDTHDHPDCILAETECPKDKWIHVALVIGPMGDGRLYLDGKVWGKGQTHPPRKVVHQTGFLGMRSWGKDSGYNGLMDEFAAWGRTLSEKEIKSLYDYSKSGKSYCAAMSQEIAK